MEIVIYITRNDRRSVSEGRKKVCHGRLALKKTIFLKVLLTFLSVRRNMTLNKNLKETFPRKKIVAGLFVGGPRVLPHVQVLRRHVTPPRRQTQVKDVPRTRGAIGLAVGRTGQSNIYNNHICIHTYTYKYKYVCKYRT